jgi:hypothetical protein
VTVKPKYPKTRILLAFLILTVGCHRERSTEVRVQGAASPAFVFRGSGELASFSVYLVPTSPKDMTKPFSEHIPVWRISALPDYLHGVPVEGIGTVTYGTVPRGYKQEVPSNGASAQSLIPDRDYFFDARTTNAPPTAGFFRIENGKAVPTKVKTPCWQTKDGEWVKSPCAE